MEKIYDLIIVGAGPAGLTAGIYAGRYMLNTLVIGETEGGMIGEAHQICNFPTYKSITGFELVKKLVDQVKGLGIEIKHEKVEKINKSKDNFEIKTSKSIYKSKTIILATGSKKRKLNVEGESKFIGRGVSYCATCDAAFFKDKVVAVAGGGNAALTAALLLAEYAKKVYIIYRKEKFFRAEPRWIKQVEENKKIEPIFNTNITKIEGINNVEKIMLDSGEKIKVDGVFVEIGTIPNIELSKQLKLDHENDYIVVDKFQKTSLEGVFAAGDVTNNPLKQAITAAAEGALAANSAYTFIKGGK